MRRIFLVLSLILGMAFGLMAAGPVDVPVFLTEEQGMASAMSHPYPHYSKAALQLKIEGRVGISISVGRDGSIYDSVISFGNPVLTQMAVEGVKTWKFKPFQDENGKAVKAMFPVTFDFHLPKS